MPSRAFIAGLLAFVGLVLVPLADVGIWTRRELLDRDDFTELASNVVHEDAVRGSLADRLTVEIDRQTRVSAAGQAIVQRAVVTVLATGQFDVVFRAALGGMHDQLERGDDRLTLGLDPAVPLVKSTVAQTNPDIAARIPDAGLPVITVVTRDEAPELWSAINIVRRAAWVFPLMSVLALIAAVAVADRRGTMLVAIGATIVVLAIVLILVVKLGRDPLSNVVGPRIAKDAFDAGYDVVTDTFVKQTLVLGLIGAIAGGAGVGLIVAERRNERPGSWA